MSFYKELTRNEISQLPDDELRTIYFSFIGAAKKTRISHLQNLNTTKGRIYSTTVKDKKNLYIIVAKLNKLFEYIDITLSYQDYLPKVFDLFQIEMKKRGFIKPSQIIKQQYFKHNDK